MPGRSRPSNAWRIYDELIEEIGAAPTVEAAEIGPNWCRVLTSDGSMGMAYALDEGSRPSLMTGRRLKGRSLRDAAALVKSWNFHDAGIGMAAINAWHSNAGRAAQQGFTPSAVNDWTQAFNPFRAEVAGAVVSVIGHFPFAPAALADAAELHVLERAAQAGDYPDSACEYLLPGSDFVFISGSAFVNKTMPRLLELARDAFTVVLGPSTPMSPVLFEHGVDLVTGFAATSPDQLFATLSGPMGPQMYESGRRLQRSRS